MSGKKREGKGEEGREREEEEKGGRESSKEQNHGIKSRNRSRSSRLGMQSPCIVYLL